MNPNKMNSPVFSTVVGGYVETWNGIDCHFLEVPNGLPFKIGDPLPKGWFLFPANKAAEKLRTMIARLNCRKS